MSRIRTVKPELPQDEVVGSVSRDARLCWILLFTVADDEGRFRAHPALLAGQLFPYDNLTVDQVESWLTELDAAGLVRRYRVKGQTYGTIPGWEKHQVIQHKGQSRIPSPDEADAVEITDEAFRIIPETFTKVPETFTPDLGPRTEDLGPRTVHAAPTGAVSLSPGAVSLSVQRDELGVSSTQSGATAKTGDVQQVFAAWKAAGGLNGRAKLTADRAGKIKARRRDGYPLEDLLDAVRGIWACVWNVEHGRTDLALALRDAEHLERFRDIYRGLRPREDQAKAKGPMDEINALAESAYRKMQAERLGGMLE